MRQRPVAVALLSLSRRVGLLLCALLFGTLSCGAFSQDSSDSSLPQMSPVTAPGFLARINKNSPDDVHMALMRAEQLFVNSLADDSVPPLVFVLHGPEVSIFLHQNYLKHKAIIDLAARLTALNVIEVRVCETRVGIMGQDKSALFPFVGTVPFGPKEERRLKKEGFGYF